MGAVPFDVLKRKHEKLALQDVKEALKNLAAGRQAKTSLEKRIVSEMAFIPGGRERYQKMITEDLVRTQTGIREKTESALQRGAMYMPVIQQIFETEYGLPGELTKLPIIESSFDHEAYSSVGAAGIWQFMPRTAREYGLIVNSSIDERRDVVEASRAAAKYFRDAYRALDSWPLAITSYNHGITGMKRKVAQLGTRDIAKIVEHPVVRPLGFASNNFYPEFLAAVHIYNNQKLYFPNLPIPKGLAMTQVTLPRSYSLKQIANNLGVETHVLSSYNYGLLNPVLKGIQPIPSGYKLKVPHSHTEKIEMLKDMEPTRSTLAAMSASTKSSTKSVITSTTATKSQVSTTSISTAQATQTYVVRSGDTLSSIARKFSVGLQQLAVLNGIGGSVIKVGQKLKVPLKSSSVLVTSSKPTITTNTSARYHTIKRGETLWSISKTYGLSLDKLRALNGLKGNTVKAGQKLRIS